MAEERDDVAVEQTIREHNAPPVDQQPWCIAAPTLTAPFELKSEDATKDWLFYLPPGSIKPWEALMKQFLNKYFLASQAIAIPRDICGIKQKPSETLHDYWERFKTLCASCPQHGVSEQGLIHYFYQGLHPTERGMLDAASGESIVDKTPTDAREIIFTMAATSQDFGDSQDMPITTETNPKHNVCAITLRSGKELKNAPSKLRRGHALESDAGRPFLSTSRTKIDVHEGTFSMEFDGNVVKFNTMKYPNLVSYVCKIDIVDPVLQETLELHQQDKSIEMLIDDVNLNHLEKPNVNSSNDEKVLHKLEILNSAFDNSSITDLSHSDTKSLTSVMQEPKSELKPPLEHLKFAYLGDEPYYSAKIYKDKTQGFYDHEIFRQQLVLGQKVFLDDSELSLFPSKLQSKWTNPFVITDVYSHDVVEIKSLHTGQIFKVNGHRLKPFYEGFQNITVEEIKLVESHLKLGSSQSPT
ncbi:DNA-directed DNA polymerase [Senna tora]|uniref:DNA-directed DNA polymerase n=1 Tax=Senna tora TaxID=362788 RepID=A0A834SC26_9FABA|nr:DNA-directed DNA polymerase [Senna tora]